MSVGGFKILKWSIHVFCLVWIAASAWYIFVRPGGPDLQWQAYDRSIDQKVNDCRGSYSERYECKSALILERDSKHFNWWAERVSIVAGPALLVQAILLFIFKLDARKREKKRVEARLKRLDTQANEARARKLEEGRRLSELARLRNEAKRREKAEIKHILIVDRENEVIEPLTNTLIECGHEVTAVADIDAALLDFDVAVYDAVMIDIFQENMGGLEGLSGLRGNKYETRVIPMSAGFATLSDDEVQRAAEKIGVEAILVKPLDFSKIPATIAKILSLAAPQPPAKETQQGEDAAPDAKKKRSA